MASSKVGDAAATQVSLGSETDKGRTEESPVIPKIYQHITVVAQVVPCDLTDFKGNAYYSVVGFGSLHWSKANP